MSLRRFLALLILAGAPAAAGAGMRTEEVWIPMKDGVRLAATLFRPDPASWRANLAVSGDAKNFYYRLERELRGRRPDPREDVAGDDSAGQPVMPITYRFDQGRGRILTACVGHVTLPEVIAHFDTLQRDPDCPRRLDVLLDLTRVTSFPEAPHMRAAAERGHFAAIRTFRQRKEAEDWLSSFWTEGA